MEDRMDELVAWSRESADALARLEMQFGEGLVGHSQLHQGADRRAALSEQSLDENAQERGLERHRLE